MKAGKLSEAVLKRSVLRQLHTVRPEVLAGPGVGADCAVVASADDCAQAYAVGTMPLATARLVEHTVYNALNNIACGGADPVGILVNLLLPTAAGEQELRDIMGRIDAVCEQEEIQVLGGHTEVVRSVNEPVLTVTAVGAVLPERGQTKAHITPGMDIVVAAPVAMAGTALLANGYQEQLRARYAQPFIDRAGRLGDALSVRTAAQVAARCGVMAMHDISEGGIYGALWEFAQRFGVGLEIDLKAIPIRQETVEICEFFDINPYKLLSTGGLLLAVEDGNGLIRALAAEGVEAAVVGKATDSNDRVLICEDERRFLETTQTDELWKLMK